MHDLFKKRRSVRRFSDRSVEDSKVKAILTAAMVAPSGCNMKKYEFIIVRDKEMLDKLSKIGMWVHFIKDCSVAIVVISPEYTFWVEDCSLVNAHMMLEAVNQGLGSCWADVKDGKELDNTDREPLVRKLLGIPDDYRVLNILAIGYGKGQYKPHTEDEYKKSKVHQDKF